MSCSGFVGIVLVLVVVVVAVVVVAVVIVVVVVAVVVVVFVVVVVDVVAVVVVVAVAVCGCGCSSGGGGDDDDVVAVASLMIDGGLAVVICVFFKLGRASAGADGDVIGWASFCFLQWQEKQAWISRTHFMWHNQFFAGRFQMSCFATCRGQLLTP